MVAGITRIQSPYFSENVVGPGIEPGTSGSVARNSGNRSQRLSIIKIYVAFKIKQTEPK
jgi:hypothetical protein